MFVKPITIPDRKTGKRYTYYRLCESYRVGNLVRHRSILNLGKLEELPDREDHKLLADRIEQILYGRPTLFDSQIPEKINRLANHFARIIIDKRLLDVPEGSCLTSEINDSEGDYEEIDISGIRHEEVREVGAEWLSKQALEQLGLMEYLLELGWNERWVKRAMIYIIGRAVFPASENKLEDWLSINTGLAELYGEKKVTRHHLYKVSRMLYKDKERIEQWLAKKSDDLFTTYDKITLYDLTNLYFEGQKNESEKAKFGHSKEKRSDAKLMALGLVLDTFGFIKYSHIYEGNIRDSKTLKKTISSIEERYEGQSVAKKIIVMDAGIATEENLKMLRDDKRDYVCVSLAKLNDYYIEEIEETGIKLNDKEGVEIYAKWVESSEHEDRILYVKSKRKELKEQAMEGLFCKRFEEGLKAIKEGIGKKGGIKKIDKVYERIGRLKERYPSVNRMYEIRLKAKDGIATEIEWEKKTVDKRESGVYFIRTTLRCEEEETIWKIYNTIREIEATFRTLKSELNMRPVFHQKDINCEAHIYGSLLAYMVVNTIRHQLKAKGINSEWSNIVRVMSTQKVVTTKMHTRTGRIIYLKRCSEPVARVREIYHALNYKDRPFWEKKSVLPKIGNPQKKTPNTS